MAEAFTTPKSIVVASERRDHPKSATENYRYVRKASQLMCTSSHAIKCIAILFALAWVTETKCFAQRTLAIRGAKLETIGKAGAIEEGVILIRDGKIEAIGKDVKIPLATQVIEAKGKTIMPGIVDPYYVITVGRDSQAGESRTIVVRGQTITLPGGPQSSSTSFTKIADSIDLESIDWKAARRSGITTMQLVVSGYGQSAIAQATAKAAQIVNADGKLLITVTNSTQSLDVLRNGLKGLGSIPSGGPGGPGSGLGRSGGPRPGPQPPSPQPPSPQPPSPQPPVQPTENLAANTGATQPAAVSPTQKLWTDVKEGKSSVFVNLNNAAAILHSLSATKESKQAKIVFIAVGSDLFEVIGDLDPKTHTAILSPRLDFLPNTRDRINIPNILNEKEMPFAFSLSLGQSEFRAQQDTPLFAVSTLVRSGLNRQKALEAITMVPAKLIGLENEVGSLEVGKKANFLILDGDPFGATTSIQRVYIEGKQIHEN